MHGLTIWHPQSAMIIFPAFPYVPQQQKATKELTSFFNTFAVEYPENT